MGPYVDHEGHVLPKIKLNSGKIYGKTIEPTQLKVHVDDSRFRAIVGQVGSGKSLTMSAEAFYHSYAYRDNLGFILMRSKPQMSIAALPSFEEAVPRSLVWRKSEDNWLIINKYGVDFIKNGGYKLAKKVQEKKLDEIGGLSRVVFTSFTGTVDALDKWASGNIGFFMIDQAEKANEKVYEMLVERMRREPSGQQGWLVANPRADMPEESTWLWRYFHEDSPYKLKMHSYHSMTTFDNAKNLRDEYIESMQIVFSKETFARRVSGDKDQYGMTDAVFPELNRITHVVPHKDPPLRWEKGFGLDVGLREATAFIQLARLPTGEFYAFDEYQEPGVASIHAKEIVRRKSPQHLYYVIDPTAVKREYISNTRQVDEFIRFGLPFMPAPRDVIPGVNRIREYLQFVQDRENPFTKQMGSPKLFISDRCHQLIEQLEIYRWEELKTHIGFSNQPEKPRKYKDHLVDALRFILAVMSIPLSSSSEFEPMEAAPQPVDANVKKDEFVQPMGGVNFFPLLERAKQQSTGRSNMSVPSWTEAAPPQRNRSTSTWLHETEAAPPQRNRSTSTWLHE